jgi:hypothetical protein
MQGDPDRALDLDPALDVPALPVALPGPELLSLRPPTFTFDSHLKGGMLFPPLFPRLIVPPCAWLRAFAFRARTDLVPIPEFEIAFDVIEAPG